MLAKMHSLGPFKLSCQVHCPARPMEMAEFEVSKHIGLILSTYVAIAALMTNSSSKLTDWFLQRLLSLVGGGVAIKC